MTESYTLAASDRVVVGKKVNRERLLGRLPAVMYGRGFDSESLFVDLREFMRVYKEAGTSALVGIELNDKKINVIFHEPDLHPTTEMPIHVDFYRVRMDEKITTEIPITIIGESPAVLDLEGSLVQTRDSIEIETLPANLIPEVEVDISRLKTFEDQIRVSDLKVPETIEILTDMDEVIFLVQPPRSEEELAEMDEVVATDDEKALVESLNAEPVVEGAEGGEMVEAKKEEE